jgi:diguanylate cyclase (GGDEF)-like protein
MADTALEGLMKSARLPTIPAIAVKIVDLVQRPEVSIEQLAETIAADPALAARVLKTANSGFYGRPRSITLVREAVMVLGLRTVKTLALGFSLVGNLRVSGQAALWQRSLLAAAGARIVATRAGLRCADEAFLCALLHRLGVVALEQAFGPRYAAIASQAGSDFVLLRQLEQKHFGLDHSEVGAALAERWNLPSELVAGIRFFPSPALAPRELRSLVDCVAAGSAVSDLIGGGMAARDLVRFRDACAMLGIAPEDADSLVPEVIGNAAVFVTMLELPQAEVSADEVLSRANEALLQLTLEVEQENARLELERLALTTAASTDPLTGLANRRHLEEFLAEQVRIAARYSAPLSLFMLDLDHFKDVNDTLGHDAGDQVLQEVAARIRGQVRDADLVARYGGEEFVVVLPASDLASAVASAERVRQALAGSPIALSSGTSVEVRASIGVSSYQSSAPASPGALLLEADRGLYEAKDAGRNAVRTAGAAHEPAA